MSFSVITQFAPLVFLQKWKFVLQREAHSTPSKGLLEHGGGGGGGSFTDKEQELTPEGSTRKES